MIALYTALLLLSALVVVFIPLFSLPPFHKGVFFQSEPIAIGLCLALAVAALALALHTQRLNLVRTRVSVPFLIAAAFAVLSLLLAAFHQQGLRSLQSSLEFGDGPVSFLLLATSIALGHSLFRMHVTRWLLVGGMVALILLLVINKGLMLHLPDWQILWFSDYLALYMVPLAFVYLALSRHWHFPARLTGMLATAGLMLCLAWLSDSRSSFVALLFVLLTWLFLLLTQRSWSSRWPVAGIIVLIVCTMAGSFSLVWYIGHQVIAEDIMDQPAVVQSIWSRYQLAKIVLTALSSHWSTWLTGLGWGSFRDFVVLFGPGQDGVHFFPNAKGVLITNWDSINRLTGHSHSMYLESLLAIGIWGPILWVAFFCSLVRAISVSARPAVLALLLGHIFLTSVWFLLPMALSFFGLASGMLLAAFESEEEWKYETGGSALFSSRPVAVMVFATISSVLFTTTSYAWNRASYGERLMNSVSTPDFRGPNGSCGDTSGVPHEGEYSGRALLSVANLLEGQPPSSVASKEQRAKTDEIREWFARLSCISAADLEIAPSHFLRYARLQSRYMLSVSGRIDTTDPRMRVFWSSWPTELETFARLGSTHEELILAYITRLYEYGNPSEILNFCHPDFTQVGQGAACQLFRGMVLAKEADTRHAGQRSIRHAIDAGIEKFMALPPSFHAKYLDHPPELDAISR